MINTIKKILDFDISDDKKLDLIRALVKENHFTYGSIGNGLGQVLPLNGTQCGTSVKREYLWN